MLSTQVDEPGDVGCRLVSAPTAERTLVLVKPDGVARGLVGEVVGRLEAKGLARCRGRGAGRARAAAAPRPAGDGAPGGCPPRAACPGRSATAAARRSRVAPARSR